jgi:predicted amidohydrolase YtcJ
MTDLVLRRVEVDGRAVDVAVDRGVITAVGERLPAGDGEVDGEGGALIPGLHDHHLHLFATAAAADSVDMRGDGDAALRAADASLPSGAWIRGVGWHEALGWDLDRGVLDAVVRHRPVRVQHASGGLWVLNTRALEAVGMADHPTGRLFGMDAVLRDRLGGEPPDLLAVGRELAAAGVTAVTDATPYTRVEDVRAIDVPQRVTVTGAPELDVSQLDDLDVGPAKVIVADHAPPSVEELIELIAAARHRSRNVAFHCASRLALVLVLAALDDAGARPGDRIEHGSVIPDDAIPTLLRLGLTVVTQPGFVAERGDRYLDEVDPDDVAHLWRCGSLLAAAVPVLGSSDAPYGPLDPWQAMRAATTRLTPRGRPLGAGERITPEAALHLYIGERRVEVGAPADLCLLTVPLRDALAELDAGLVRATFA